jgi:peptidylprolyl isomerase
MHSILPFEALRFDRRSLTDQLACQARRPISGRFDGRAAPSVLIGETPLSPDVCRTGSGGRTRCRSCYDREIQQPSAGLLRARRVTFVPIFHGGDAMTRAKAGDTVRVHYTGKLEDGSVFDSSENREPLEFTIGAGQVIPGFEAAVTGMATGESKSATIPPEEGYGPRRKEMMAVVDREQLPDDLDVSVGQRLQVQQSDGRQLVVSVADIADETVTLDANHELAGKTLTFDLQLVEVV